MEPTCAGNGTVTTLPEELGEPATQTAKSPVIPGGPWRQKLVVLVLLVSDFLLASLIWGLAFLLYGIWGDAPLSGEIITTYVLGNTAVWLVLRASVGLYPGYGLSAPEELRRQTYAALATLAITAIFALAIQLGDALPALLVGLNALGRLVLAPLGRHFVKQGLAKVGLWGKSVVVLGAGETGEQLIHTLQREWGLGYKPAGVFDFRLNRRGGVREGVPYSGTVIDAVNLARKQSIDTVIFAMPHVRLEYLERLVDHARRCFQHVVVIPNLGGVTTSAVTARDLSGIFGVEIKHNLLDPGALRTKRTLDFVATLVGGTLILPLLLVIGFLVWVDSRGGVFYRAKRMGRDGKLFPCLKFRTMVPDAEATLQRVLQENSEMREQYLKYHKLHDDPRITRIGRFLRKTSLDELPQLWNVLRGEMSLTGPRPYLPRESAEIGTAQSEILRVPPGITGPWQVAGRNGIPFKERVQMDDYYVRNWSVWLDLIILSRTVKVLAFGRGGAH